MHWLKLLGALACTPAASVADTDRDTARLPCLYEDQPDASESLSLDGDVACGEMLYVADCASCHGASGGGEAETSVANVPNLAEMAKVHSDADLVLIVIAGVTDMPATAYGGQEMADLLAWFRATFGEVET